VAVGSAAPRNLRIGNAGNVASFLGRGLVEDECLDGERVAGVCDDSSSCSTPSGMPAGAIERYNGNEDCQSLGFDFGYKTVSGCFAMSLFCNFLIGDSPLHSPLRTGRSRLLF
jgi:hypothetical protein